MQVSSRHTRSNKRVDLRRSRLPGSPRRSVGPLAPLSHPDQDAKHPAKISAPSVVRDTGSAGLAAPLTTALFSGVELKPFETEASPSFRKLPNRFAHVPFKDDPKQWRKDLGIHRFRESREPCRSGGLRTWPWNHAGRRKREWVGGEQRRASAGHTRMGVVELCSMFVATLQSEQLLSSHSDLCWQVQQRPSEDDAIRKALQDESNVRLARQRNVLHMRC